MLFTANYVHTYYIFTPFSSICLSGSPFLFFCTYMCHLSTLLRSFLTIDHSQHTFQSLYPAAFQSAVTTVQSNGGAWCKYTRCANVSGCGEYRMEDWVEGAWKNQSSCTIGNYFTKWQKVMVFGWNGRLEGKETRERKTVLYWMEFLNEFGVNWTDVERVRCVKYEWKKFVSERMEHLDKWDWQEGRSYRRGPNDSMCERSERRVTDLVCSYDGCVEVCKSIKGLSYQQKLIHRSTGAQVSFKCGACGGRYETEVACGVLER